MSMLSEFKEFISKGNVIDLAVGVIIGAAFGKIVTSFVDDIIMPPIGYILGGIDFANKKIILVHADVPNKVTEVAIRYGNFVNTVIQFLIIAFCVFILIKGINSLKRQKEAEAAAAHVPTEAENLLAEIRDILRSQRSI